MNRKQQRRERKLKNRDNYFRNRRNWVMDGGPVVVMDDPTEEHVKALLMVWLAPRRIMADVADTLTTRQQQRMDSAILKALSPVFDPEMRELPDMLWGRLFQLATMPLTVEQPVPPQKLYTA